MSNLRPVNSGKMPRMSKVQWFVAAVSMWAAVASAATGQEQVEGIMGGDRFMAGGSITRTDAVAGDLIAAGGEVQLDAAVGGDAVAAGGNVRVGGSVGQNLYAAGGRVNLTGTFSRNVRVAGGRVEIDPTASIQGNLTAAGGTLRLRGVVKGYVQATGGNVTIDGPVDGDVSVSSGNITLGPNARIGGNLRYRSGKELVREPGAKVVGTVERLSAERASEGPVVRTHIPGFSGGWIWSAGLIVLAALMAAAVPPASMRISGELRMHPWLALLFGFIAVVCIPMAAIVLMVTVIGIPLAMLVLLAYIILLALGYVSTAVAFGDTALANLRPAEAQRSSWRVLAAIVAMLLLTLIARIPFLGGLFAFAAMLVGSGAMLLAMRPSKPTAPAAAAQA